MLLIKRACFSSHLVLKIYVENCVRTRNIRINGVHTSYGQEKGYYELLSLLSMLFVHLFVHIRECDYSTQVGVEPVFYLDINNLGVFVW